MLLSERLYFCFHSAALDGVPVTMPESLQLRVLSRAGAIWLLERLPSPHNATPSLRVGAWPKASAPTPANSGAAASAAVCVRNWRRGFWVMAIRPCGLWLTTRRESLAECTKSFSPRRGTAGHRGGTHACCAT